MKSKLGNKEIRGTETVNVTPGGTEGRILVTVRDAAAMISSRTATIRRLIKQGRLPYCRLGKPFLIDPRDLAALIPENKIGGNS